MFKICQKVLILMALLWWKRIPHTISNSRFSLWNVVLLSVMLQHRPKVSPIWVSVSVLDLNQNSGFGRTLKTHHFSIWIETLLKKSWYGKNLYRSRVNLLSSLVFIWNKILGKRIPLSEFRTLTINGILQSLLKLIL